MWWHERRRSFGKEAWQAARRAEMQRWIALGTLGPGTATPMSTDTISYAGDSEQDQEEEIDRTLRTAEDYKAALRNVSRTIHRF